MLDLAVSLWLGALLVTSALLGLVLLVQSTVRVLRSLLRRPSLGAERLTAAPADRRLAA